MLCQMQALGQMSLLPARRLEKFCPGMRRKGRVCLGGDADIVVFDAATVRALHVYIYIARALSGSGMAFIKPDIR